jgi:hypothetical protein
MNRAQASMLVFAILTALVTGATAFIAYRGQRAAFENEFARRLAQLAELAASQVSPADLADARQLGTDGNGLLALQLDALCSATGLTNVSVLDDSSRVVYDVRAGFATLGTTSPYDSLAHDTIVRARTVRSVPFPPFRRGQSEMRAAAARIGDAPGAVLVAEDQPTWEPELAQLRRDLSLLAAVSVLAVAALALLVLRASTSQVSLERRLSRAQNLAAMGRMTATLAHEIKNPLAIIPARPGGCPSSSPRRRRSRTRSWRRWTGSRPRSIATCSSHVAPARAPLPTRAAPWREPLPRRSTCSRPTSASARSRWSASRHSPRRRCGWTTPPSSRCG